MPTLATVGFIAVLGVVCVTDLRRRRIPNLATGAAAAIGLFGILATDPEGLPVALLASLTVALPLLLASLVRPEGMAPYLCVAALVPLINIL